MDTRLHEKLMGWHEQIERLKPLELRFLELESQEKAMLAKLTLASDGKSHAERESRALACDDWRDFQAGLVSAKSEYLDAKRRLDLRVKAYEAEYLTLKVEGDAARRAVG